MADVRIERITKQFGQAIAVNDLSLHVRDHEFVSLLGPSGCGKTTTMRCVAGLERPDAGQIFIGERDVTTLLPRDRDVALVFQSYALYPHMTTRNNIGYPLRLRGMDKPKRDAAVEETAMMFGIDELLERFPRQLSGGQQQRVALSRAVVRQPRAFLMDEPLSNIDALLRVTMRAELKRLQQQLGITTIFVTHDQVEALTLSDRIVVMEFGTVQQVGKPLEIYRQPANLFVARFVGSPPMNFFEGELRSEAGETVFVSDMLRVPVVAPRHAPANRVTLGVRPESLTVESAPSDGATRAKIALLEPLGYETIVHATIGSDVVRSRVADGEDLAVDQDVWLRIGSELLFDTQSGVLLS
ncbi:MAG: ABC transporter ATP-binding protein [Thermomicrobiales bacterium]|nr:ABC transporter ATP-binding protein [Thermomicrobiales bacterium]